MDKFNFHHAQFEYEPYPVCYIPNFLSEADYKALSESYPPLEMFKHKPLLGDKYSLAEFKNNEQFYHTFLKANPCWRDFYEKIKTKAFIEEVLSFLRDRHIDLGIRRFWYCKKLAQKRRSWFTRIVNKRVLRSRFEFAIMPANGGHILPHTDDKRKFITMVFSFIKPGEWNPSWGGGTDVLKPKDRARTYNQVNYQLPFDQVEVVKTFPFNPNQCVLFIKTYNSWHSVQPMTGPATGLRKTVTLNIEDVI